MIRSCRKSLPALAVGAALAASAGCGGGGGGGDTGSNDPASTTTITGTVEAPNGSLAQVRDRSLLARASDWLFVPASAEITGLQSVSGLQIDVVDLDTGDVVIPNVAQTGSGGEFSFDTDLDLRSSLALRVSGSTIMRAPLSDASVDLNPVSEAVTRALEDAVTGGASFADFTIEEIETLVDYLQSQDLDLSSASSIDDAVTRFDSASPGTADLVDEIATADGTSGELGGDYGAVLVRGIVFQNEMTAGAVNFGYETPDLTFNSDGSVDTSATSTEGQASMSVSGGLLSVTLGNPSESGPNSFPWSQSGSRLYVNTEGTTQLGATAAGGDLFGLSLRESFRDDISATTTVDKHERGMVLGFRKTSSAPAVSGDYHLVGLDQNYYYQAGSSGTSDYIEFLAGSIGGSMTVAAGGSASVNINNDDLIAGSGPSDTALAGGTSTDTPTGSLSVTSDGGVSAFGGTGQAAPDGSVFALALADAQSDEFTQTLIIGVKKGSSCDAGTLAGTYNYQSLGLRLDAAPAGAMQPALLTSPFVSRGTFSSDDTNTFTLDYNSTEEAELFVSESSFAVSGVIDGGGDSGTATVNSDCSVSISGLGASVQGAVSPDGRFVVVAVGDGAAGDTNGSRELVVGYRRN